MMVLSRHAAEAFRAPPSRLAAPPQVRTLGGEKRIPAAGGKAKAKAPVMFGDLTVYFSLKEWEGLSPI
ncbi:zinc finger protein 667 [Phyllostomus discolor]|uniref:Zinc finger protein 667 n=1 Tax=Phyllostomus discolor TaxID=89673 RepID=A0A833YTP7_9CHIR|nr:zinc finger protein 667 [Phyllostomus discolor]